LSFLIPLLPGEKSSGAMREWPGSLICFFMHKTKYVELFLNFLITDIISELKLIWNYLIISGNEPFLPILIPSWVCWESKILDYVIRF
jgi:hypothetical protein